MSMVKLPKKEEPKATASAEALAYVRQEFQLPETNYTDAGVVKIAMAVMGIGKLADYPFGETHLLLASVKMRRPGERVLGA